MCYYLSVHFQGQGVNSRKVFPRNNKRPMIQVFWYVTPSCPKRVASLLSGSQSMKNEPHAVPKLRLLYQSMWLNIPEDILLRHYCDNQHLAFRRSANSTTIEPRQPIHLVRFLSSCSGRSRSPSGMSRISATIPPPSQQYKHTYKEATQIFKSLCLPVYTASHSGRAECSLKPLWEPQNSPNKSPSP